MPSPVVILEVEESAAGRRIYKDEAEQVINEALASLYGLIMAIPSGPIGERGPVGPQGDQWVIGQPRAFAEGLTCVAGNAIYRHYTESNAIGLFRCLSATTTSLSSFPATPVSNATWQLVLLIPGGARGPEGPQGLMGPSPAIVEFPTDAEALVYSTENPSAIVISLEGL